MRKQLYSQSSGGEPQIIVEESTIGEEEAERKRDESPPRCLDPDSPSLNPYLLSPWRETRKHSLPTPQCTSGITASQVRRLSERGGEGSGPSPREAAFLATLSQAPAPQPGGRRHSVVTISKVPTTLFGRNRRESIAAFPLGATRILPIRRDSSSGLGGPPSNSGSTHNLQLDIMDDIAEIKARKVRLKMWKTPSRERICEVQPLEGNSSSQKYTQQHRRFSDFAALSSIPSPSSLLRRRASEYPKPSTSSSTSGTSPGIICSNTDLISILSSLTSSATEINRCGEEKVTRDDNKSTKNVEHKRRQLKDFRSNSFDVSILHGTGNKQIRSLIKNANKNEPAFSWFVNRHKPMSKKQKGMDITLSSLSEKLDKLNVIKAVKETFVKSTSPPKESSRHKVVWDDASGTKVDAQILGSAIEEFLTSQRNSDIDITRSKSSSKSATSPIQQKSGKISSWFSGSNEGEETTEASICSSLKDLFVK
ncbi:uncharacterized protein kairos [Chelonus insularis]|uniref:uncharacterized protein kairos n=1 Tax=Chelonus insularis TaxID=460826 RepID=UPI00158C8214|nr:uncharacterized protein LOC118069999 [Chelonus insularis]XP_034944289.1 uncharacterized protein LOC118069999 [Chelonus insularis]XP_034944290.1 uncharacterized protein LOC118069999 [Chelonus insularis]XP_034944291.1 uncharacterized protein LOC118069999 [Chelonus insularis]